MSLCDLHTVGIQDNWNIHLCRRCGRQIKSHSTAEKTMRQCTKPGLGDAVHYVLNVTGIGPAYRWLRGGNCGGCKRRQDWLNKLGG